MGTRTVYLSGQARLPALVTSSLEFNPHLHVIHESAWEELKAQAAARLPDVLIFDLQGAAENASLPFLHLHPDLLLIGLDIETNRAVLVTGKERQALSISDLVEVIRGGGNKVMR